MRLARILDVLVDGEGSDPRRALDRLCRACVQELEVTGAGLALIFGGGHRGTIGVSDGRVARVEELQFTLGEGPCLDAHESGRPVLEARLAESSRWPTFGPEAVEAGVAAVFSVPLRRGAARFGVLDLYCDAPGPLGPGVLADAVAVAEAATTLVTEVQARAPSGSLPDLLGELAEQRAVVHQATGMVSVQLGVTLEEALVALRARSYSEGRTVGIVATEVVTRLVRFNQ
ncbi:MAG: GAF and ANTAR domain-containing protein [Actinomycetota bacterium]|nr:GAF and ANTAR domain-containing protein [Acidimicrobiia bacterium]MDQ3147040.1 GAF and ANTAR domain-containing protein [Actinomycetota bacterium]